MNYNVNEIKDLIAVNYEAEQPTVSARDLHGALGINKRFSAWFESNSQGFAENEDYTSVLTGTEVQNNGGIQIRELQDYKMSVDMAKHICLMSKTEKGKQIRQYFLDLEKAWNTPEQVFARALKESQPSLTQEAKPKKKPIIICGDFNVAATELDLKNPKNNVKNAGFTPEEREKFKTLLDSGFTDSYRYLHPDTEKYSWWSYRFKARERNAGWRIDYFLTSDSIKDKIKDAEILTDVMGSDHCPIELDIDI